MPTQFLKLPYEIGTIVVSIVQTEEMKLTEVK